MNQNPFCGFTGKEGKTIIKIDYVLNEKVCKNDNSVTFISNSFHAQPAEKPKPVEKKKDNSNEDNVILDESGGVPNSTNVGTTGGYMGVRGQDSNYSPGSKRPRSPLNRRGRNQFGASSSPSQGGRLGNSGAENYDNGSVFQGGGEEDDSYSEYDQKPILDADGSVKQEHMPSQGFPGSSRLSGRQPQQQVTTKYIILF